MVSVGSNLLARFTLRTCKWVAYKQLANLETNTQGPKHAPGREPGPKAGAPSPPRCSSHAATARGGPFCASDRTLRPWSLGGLGPFPFATVKPFGRVKTFVLVGIPPLLTVITPRNELVGNLGLKRIKANGMPYIMSLGWTGWVLCAPCQKDTHPKLLKGHV